MVPVLRGPYPRVPALTVSNDDFNNNGSGKPSMGQRVAGGVEQLGEWAMCQLAPRDVLVTSLPRPILIIPPLHIPYGLPHPLPLVAPRTLADAFHLQLAR
jgi:hypothetical protein